MSEDFVFVAKLDDSQILKALQNIDDEASKVGQNLDSALKGASQRKIIEDKEKKKLEDVEKEAKKFEASLKALIAAELQTAAGSDKVTKSFITQASAGAQNAQALINSVSQTNRLSKAQIDYATKIGTTKAQIRQLTQELSKEGADTVALTGQIRQLINSLNTMDDAQESAAAATQQAADEFRDGVNDIEQWRRAEKGAADEADRLERETKEAGEQTGQSADRMKAAHAVLAGAVAAVTNALINMGRRGVQALKDLLAESIQVAANFEGVEASFLNIFEGSKAAADATFKLMKAKSREIGIDLSQIYRRFLPQVGDLEQVDKLAEIAASLAVLEPEQGIQGALLSLQDILVGEGTSLRKRYELPTDEIFELQEAFGDVEGAILGLDKLLADRGVAFRQLSDIFQIAMNRMQIEFLHFRDAIGQPITEELNKQFRQILDFASENREELTLLAYAIGDVFTAIARLLGAEVEDFLADWDISQTIEDIELLAITIETLGEVIDAFQGTSSDMTFGEKWANLGLPISGNEEQVQEKFDASFMEATLKGIQIQAKLAIVAIENLRAAWNALLITTAGAQLALARIAIGKGLEDARQIMIETAKAADEALAQGAIEAGKRLTAMDEIVQKNTESIQERTKALEAATEAGEESANMILRQNQAARDLETAKEALAAAEKEVNEEIEQLETEALQRRMQLQIDYTRDVLDNEKKTSEARQDLTRDYIRQLEKIFRKGGDDLADSQTRRDRDIEDARRKHEQKIIDDEKKSAKKKLDIEEDYQRKLAEIRRKFDFDAEEAIRANDAVALMRIRRRMQFELNEARINRDEKLEDEDKSRREEEERRDDGLERDIEAARIAYQRRIEDLDLALQREQRERRIAFAQELADIETQEKRRRETIDTEYQRNLEDLKRNLNLKRALLQESLDDEIEAVRLAEAEKYRLIAQGFLQAISVQNQMLASAQNFMSNLATIMASGTFNTSGTPGVSRTPGGGGHRPRRATGGPVRQGEPTLVGEPIMGRPNPEIFVPGSDGYIFPLRNFMYSPMSAMGAGGSIDNSRNLSATMNFPDPNGLNPIQKAEVVALATSVLGRVLVP